MSNLLKLESSFNQKNISIFSRNTPITLTLYLRTTIFKAVIYILCTAPCNILAKIL